MSEWISTQVSVGSSAMRSSSTDASVGHSSVRSIPMSFMSARRGSGSKNASGLGIAFGFTPVCAPEDGLPSLSCDMPQLPGCATRENVGFGM